MITVAGEALIDLIVDPAGHIDPSFGGGPFNVVRAVARLGLPAAFLGRLSSDRFGRLMREDLHRHGVLAAVEVDSMIPLEAFIAVAEILAYVYRANQIEPPSVAAP